jgi:hypothetical protein
MANQFDIKVKGLDTFARAIHAQADRIDKASENIVKKGAAIVGSEAKRGFKPRPIGSVRTSKTGKIYYSSKPPFQARPISPTSRSGHLRDSIHMVEVKRVGPGRWVSSTGPTMKYGAMVEKGSSVARAFPYMAPGLNKSLKILELLYKEEWGRALA